MSRSCVSLAVFLALALSVVCGCQGKPPPADASTARATLQRFLDSWKSGTSPDDFEQKNPSLAVVDPQWKEGTRLVSYDIDASEKPAGFDLRFSVKLSLVDAEGQKSEQKTTYTVSTSPALVIVRGEEGQ
jgi:hypothetical protein